MQFDMTGLSVRKFYVESLFMKLQGSHVHFWPCHQQVLAEYNERMAHWSQMGFQVLCTINHSTFFFVLGIDFYRPTASQESPNRFRNVVYLHVNDINHRTTQGIQALHHQRHSIWIRWEFLEGEGCWADGRQCIWFHRPIAYITKRFVCWWWFWWAVGNFSPLNLSSKPTFCTESNFPTILGIKQ